MPDKKETPKKVAPAVATKEEEILDFSQVKPFDPLDSSRMYKVRVTDLHNEIASTGKKMVVAEFTVLAPEIVNTEDWIEDDNGDLKFSAKSDKIIKAEGRKLFRNFTKTPEALPFLYNFLKACDPEVELNEAFRFRPAEWIGSELAVRGKNNPYQEQVRLSPDKVYPVSKYKE